VHLTRRARDAHARIQLGHGVRRRISFLETIAVATNDLVRIASDFAGKRPQKATRIETTRKCGHIAAFNGFERLHSDFCALRKFRQRQASSLACLSQFCANILRLIVGHRVGHQRKRNTTASLFNDASEGFNPDDAESPHVTAHARLVPPRASSSAVVMAGDE